MQIENNKTLTTLVIVYIALTILESLFGLLSSYVMVPMLQAKSGYDGMSGYYNVQRFIYVFFNLINLVLLIAIGVQVQNTTIRVLLFVYAVTQLGWAIYPLVSSFL